MSWLSPRSWTTGEVVRAPVWNQELRDNMRQALPEVSRAMGDYFYFSGSAMVRIPIGTTNTFLRSGSGGSPTWHEQIVYKPVIADTSVGTSTSPTTIFSLAWPANQMRWFESMFLVRELNVGSVANIRFNLGPKFETPVNLGSVFAFQTSGWMGPNGGSITKNTYQFGDTEATALSFTELQALESAQTINPSHAIQIVRGYIQGGTADGTVSWVYTTQSRISGTLMKESYIKILDYAPY